MGELWGLNAHIVRCLILTWVFVIIKKMFVADVLQKVTNTAATFSYQKKNVKIHITCPKE